jgi:hypothetical protein
METSVVLGSGIRCDPLVISIIVTMLVILVLAGLVVVYVAYPHRGEDVPNLPWVGDAMKKGVEALPTLDNQREREHSHL